MRTFQRSALWLVFLSSVASLSTTPTTMSSSSSSSSSSRQLQTSDTRLWDISAPTISFSGMQLDFEHTVRDQITPNMVRIELFRDEACTRPIDSESNNYLAVDIIDDLTVTGDGSGTRKMTIDYTINPQTIRNSRIITYTDSNSIVSFCTRFSLLDPLNGSQVANFIDTHIAVRVDTVERLEILEVLQDEEANYAAEAYECNTDNEPITTTTTAVKTQGARIRICVQPDATAREFGSVMKSINSLTFTRGDVSQDIIVSDGVIQDLQLTQYRCTPGELVCHVTTTVSNAFYYSLGTVQVQGVAWLQYGSGGNSERRRGLLRGGEGPSHKAAATIDAALWNDGEVTSAGNKNEPSTPNKLGSRSVSQQQQQQQQQQHQHQHQQHRQAFEAGGFIGARNFNMAFVVEPSGTEWTAVTFLCDGRNLPLLGSALTRPRNKGDDLRVCVMPSGDARKRGVFLRQLSNFYFTQETDGGADERVQFALDSSGQQSEDTLYICNAGEVLCAFKIVLSDEFFDKNRKVTMQGQALLQYGQEPLTRSSAIATRKAQVVMAALPTALEEDPSLSTRGLQIADPTVDAGFAGQSPVTLEFDTDPTYVATGQLTWQEKAEDWWVDTPLFLRIVYIMVTIIAFLILLCFLYAICCGNPYRRKKTAPREDDPTEDIKVVVQPIYVQEPKDDQDDDHDDEDEPNESKGRGMHANSGTNNSSHRLMDSAPEKESAQSSDQVAGDGNESFAKVEPNHSKSPRKPRSGRSVGSISSRGGSKSPRSGSKTKKSAGTSKSPRSGRKMASEAGVSASVSDKHLRSPKSPRSKKNLDGTSSHSARSRRSSSMSPKPGSKKRIEDGTRGSTHSRGSTRTERIEDGTRGSTHSRGSTRTASKSPKPRRSKKAMESTGSSFKSSSSTKSPSRRQLNGSTRSPKTGGRRAAVDEPSSARSRRTPRSAKQSLGGDGTKMPDVLPFATDF